ncbi:hypothetical protein SAMN05444521_1567 [Streptomyces sp. 3214.6]|nr:hypothetical protein SAMN05444521_1567 [Streptomyces sp. 3214.6]
MSGGVATRRRSIGEPVPAGRVTASHPHCQSSVVVDPDGDQWGVSIGE